MKKIDLAEWCERFCEQLGDEDPLVIEFREKGGGEDAEVVHRPRHLSTDLVSSLYKYSLMPSAEFVHIRDPELGLSLTQYPDVAKLAYWGLLESDGGGYWRCTELARAWLRGEQKVRSTAVTVRGRGCVELTGELVGPLDVGPWEGREALVARSYRARPRSRRRSA